jgi:hypothetical protein
MTVNVSVSAANLELAEKAGPIGGESFCTSTMMLTPCASRSSTSAEAQQQHSQSPYG